MTSRPPRVVRYSTVGSGPRLCCMSAERDELRRLVEELSDDQVPSALADVRRRAVRHAAGSWPPAWFGAAVARRTDTAANVDELLAEGFGRPA